MFDLGIPLLLLAALVVLLASLTKSLTGFGFGLVATPLLLLFMEPKAMVLLSLVLSGLLSALVAVQSRAHIALRDTIPMTLAGAAGVPPGILILALVSHSALKIAIALVILLAAVLLIFGFSRPIGHQTLSATVAGFLSGVIGASTSVSGPPTALFMVNQRWDRDAFRASISAYLFFTHVIAIAGILISRTVELQALWVSVPLFVPTMAGYYLAGKLFPLIESRLFRNLALVLITGAALVALVTETLKLLAR